MFKLIHRCIGFEEIANDEKLLTQIMSRHRKFEGLISHAHIVFPWLMTPVYIWRIVMAGLLYLDFSKILARRKKEGRREDDSVQILLDKDESHGAVIEVNEHATIFSRFHCVLFNSNILRLTTNGPVVHHELFPCGLHHINFHLLVAVDISSPLP
jgi:hypothetical protein